MSLNLSQNTAQSLNKYVLRKEQENLLSELLWMITSCQHFIVLKERWRMEWNMNLLRINWLGNWVSIESLPLGLLPSSSQSVYYSCFYCCNHHILVLVLAPSDHSGWSAMGLEEEMLWALGEGVQSWPFQRDHTSSLVLSVDILQSESGIWLRDNSA